MIEKGSVSCLLGLAQQAVSAALGLTGHQQEVPELGGSANQIQEWCLYYW